MNPRVNPLRNVTVCDKSGTRSQVTRCHRNPAGYHDRAGPSWLLNAAVRRTRDHLRPSPERRTAIPRRGDRLPQSPRDRSLRRAIRAAPRRGRGSVRRDPALAVAVRARRARSGCAGCLHRRLHGPARRDVAHVPALHSRVQRLLRRQPGRLRPPRADHDRGQAARRRRGRRAIRTASPRARRPGCAPSTSTSTTSSARRRWSSGTRPIPRSTRPILSSRSSSASSPSPPTPTTLIDNTRQRRQYMTKKALIEKLIKQNLQANALCWPKCRP